MAQKQNGQQPVSALAAETPLEPTTASLTYASYLQVPALLGLQQPHSMPEQHDETLFIIIHQVYELWFKQVLHELTRCEQALAGDKLMPCLRSLKRVTTIQGVLNHQIDVLETMTPAEFNTFRDKLNPASGFQSYQFRLLEFRLGAKDLGYLKFFRNQPDAYALLEQAIAEPTLYDVFLRFLARRGFAIPQAILERDVRCPYEANEAVVAVFRHIYEHPDENYELYMALEALLDVDENTTLWRYRHVAMVERMIGALRGTGGSSGVKYLTQTLTKRFFPELWDVRSRLGSGGYAEH